MTGKSKKRIDASDSGEGTGRKSCFSLELVHQMAEYLPRWYEQYGRSLPWREGRNPYRIWVSEIMLQQTRIEAVKPYFDRFLKELPDIASLADVPEDRLLKLWEGLGYYSRARNLKKAALILKEQYQGKMPPDYQALLSLPGIGPYTAGAIASIAFRIPVPAVDGNVLRVLSRVCESREDVMKPAVRREAEAVLSACMPEDPGTFNEALMELGETICLPGAALSCETCPLFCICLAGRNRTAKDLPIRAEKKPRKVEEKTILLLIHDGKVGVRKRPDKGLLAGLYEFPNLEGFLTGEDAAARAKEFFQIRTDGEPLALGEARHLFTHVEWHMTGYLLIASQARNLIYTTAEGLDKEYALPGAFHFFKEKALQILSDVLE